MDHLKYLTPFVLLLLFPYVTVKAQQLSVSSNGRYLVTEDGRPFFYLGDTAWELLSRLDREEATHYLADRAEKGFNVIQTVVLSSLGGLGGNAYGHMPLIDRDLNKPNEQFFEHVDFVVNQAAELGLVIGMLPTWGNYWSTLNPDETIFDEKSARVFGEYLGQRYREKPIIWILGGDHNIHTQEERAIIDAMAGGLKKGDGGNHLITFHPRGPGLSSDYVQDAEWLDFNMVQSSHAAHDHDNGLFIEHDYALEPVRPTLDGEPRYEALQTAFYMDGFNRLDYFDDYDVRQAAYWAVLAGACGHTYGNNNIFQFYDQGRTQVIGAKVPWKDALDHAGAFQMGFMRDLFEARPINKLIPDQSVIMDGPRAGGSKIRAARATDGSFIIAYSPRGEKFSIDLSVLEGRYTRETWFDPRYGVSYTVHTADTKGIQTYTPPTSGRGQDWILIVDNATLDLPMPGHH